MPNKYVGLAAIVASLVFLPPAMADVSTPLVIQSEAGPVITSACLQLPGQQLPHTEWWKTDAAAQLGPEFAATMSAITRQDRQALRQTFDAAWASKSNRVDEQATALISQLRVANLRSVPYRIDLGPSRTYFAVVSNSTQTTWVPFVFRRGADGRWGYLPERGDNRWLPLILESLRALPPTAAPPACPASGVKLMASLPLGEAQMSLRFKSSQPVSATSVAPPPVQAVLKLRDAARKRDAKSYLGLLTPESASSLAAWLKKVDAPEVDRYFGAWDVIEPLWYLDLSPAGVVVLGDTGGQVRSIYTVERNGQTEIMNLSHVANADALLKAADSPLLRKGADKKFFASLQAGSR